MLNVTVQAPVAMYGAQYTARDGSSYVIGSTGLLTINSMFQADLLNAGFTLPSNIGGINGGVVAFSGGGKASAVQLLAGINQIATAAAAGDSVKLPAAAPGTYVTVINDGANPVQVFGSGTDTINGVPTGTGISQMQSSVDTYWCGAAGQWRVEGGFGFSGQLETNLAVDNIVAFAGGGQGSATPLTGMINRVVTVATAGDSVKLPTSNQGAQVTVANAHAANSLNVFPQTGDAINAAAANAAFAVAAGKTCTIYCTSAGRWHTLLSA
jgi:hypothetical protein